MQGAVNNIRMLMVEEPVVQNLNEVVRAEDIAGLNGDDERGNAQNESKEMVKGSINDIIRTQGREE